MVATSTEPVPTTHVNPARAEAYGRFREVIALLREHGWDNLRVDTLIHDQDRQNHRSLRWTVRHQYCAGEWTLTLEPDKQVSEARFQPFIAGMAPRVVKIVTGRDLPDAATIIAELFGPNVHLLRASGLTPRHTDCPCLVEPVTDRFAGYPSEI